MIESINHIVSIDTIKQITNSEALSHELNQGIEKIFELIPKEIVVAPKQATVRIATLVPRHKTTLKNSDDVNDYIDELKENLLIEINNDKQIFL